MRYLWYILHHIRKQSLRFSILTATAPLMQLLYFLIYADFVIHEHFKYLQAFHLQVYPSRFDVFTCFPARTSFQLVGQLHDADEFVIGVVVQENIRKSTVLAAESKMFADSSKISQVIHDIVVLAHFLKAAECLGREKKVKIRDFSGRGGGIDLFLHWKIAALLWLCFWLMQLCQSGCLWILNTMR